MKTPQVVHRLHRETGEVRKRKKRKRKIEERNKDMQISGNKEEKIILS
jgi:hypothetical protein